jgi:hypothetical protein
LDFGFRVSDFGFRVSDFGFRVSTWSSPGNEMEVMDATGTDRVARQGQAPELGVTAQPSKREVRWLHL